LVLFHRYKDDSTYAINKHNTTHRQNQDKNHMIISIDNRKHFWQNSASLHVKSPEEACGEWIMQSL
jgi:hypothetical protein